MLRGVNRVARRLWQDESGVVLAVTMVVFLAMFMMACAVYAVGETARLRIELQNGADAAAYSGAVVQADTLSRVAAINRAMSWTYVQMVRMEMDYIVDKWLELTLKRWEIDNLEMRLFNAPSTCHIGLPWYGTGKGVSVGNGANHKRILLNKHHLVTTRQIEQARRTAAAQGKSYKALAPKIDHCRDEIEAMNEKERNLLLNLPLRIQKTVVEVLRENVKDTWNDEIAGGAGLMYSLHQSESPVDENFRVLELDDEEDFLRHSDYISEQGGSARQIFDKGIDRWFIKEYSGGGPGVQRQYERGHPILISEWDWCSSVWQQTKAGCILVGKISGSSEVKGDDPEIYDENYYITALAEPQVLKERFFARGGSICVGLSRRLNNPFEFMAVGGDAGVLNPFKLDGGRRYMWTVSAAIAGYNPKPRQQAEGKYEVTYEPNEGERLWNLKSSDWDGVLLPLHRAWAKGKDRVWQGETAGQILNTVKGGPWVALYGGGEALGAQGAPKGMNEGAEVAYGGAEAWVLH